MKNGINFTYTLKAVPKSRSILPQSFPLQESFIVFNASEDAAPCEVYNFSVTATYTYVGTTYTGDGCSIRSPVISRTLPSLPDVEVLDSTLTYSLAKEDGGVNFNASFEVIFSLKSYTFINYLSM